MKRSHLLLLKALAMLLCFVFVIPCYADAAVQEEADAAAFSPSSLGAQSFCLMDARDKSILCQKNADTPLPMASTTKIMTAMVILSRCDLEETVTVSPNAAGTEGSSMYLSSGEKISVRSLLYGLMLESANDAAMALAIHAAGSVEEFASWMNALAAQIGMNHSHFCNPSGLSQDGHQASAADMARLMCFAMTNPVFREITAAKSARLPMAKEGEYRYLSNHNRLLDRYSHCIGGKTGYTIAAGRCLVTVSQKDGVELVAVTINDRNDWNDHIALYEYGFSLYSSVSLCEAGKLSYSVDVVGGLQSAVNVINKEALTVVLREQEGIRVTYELPFFLYAPVRTANTDALNVPLPLGRAVFFQNGVELGAVYLYPEKEVEAFVPPSLWERILKFFKIGE